MEVFNKVFSQVSSSVSQLSGVLPGNPVTREYESTTHIGSAGPGLLWRVYKGCKRSTKQEASIFVFEKRQLDMLSKSDKEFVLEIFRRGVVQLTKIRHPKVLTVQHPLEESRESLAFATEPVFASLANILGHTTNMPQPANISDYKFFDIEIKYGLLQVSEGLAFLHNDVKLLHRNICPESIIVNSQGAWKIFGFDFCVHNINPPNMVANYPCEPYSASLPKVGQPNLDFLAPEIFISQSNSPSSDMFSLGMLSYVLYAMDKKCLLSVKGFQAAKDRVQELKKLTNDRLSCIPNDLREFVKLLLSGTPEVRPDAHQFLKIPYFDDVSIKTLTYLDSLLQWDNVQKSQFYKGLPTVLHRLPQRVKLQRVFACLVHDLGQPYMVPFILPSLFLIAENCSQQEYCTYIFPHLKPLMRLTDPIQIPLMMLQKMELLLKLTPPDDVQKYVLPMMYHGLDSDSSDIHELCLSVLPTFAGLLDHYNVKNSLLPRIKKLCLSTTNLSVRVNCLLCIGRLLEHLDKWLVLDEVLPFLPQIPSREPAVLMGILGIYKLTMNHKKLGITKEILATRVLPFLIPLCIENGLTLKQFTAITTLVKEMFQFVENEHKMKLEQLNSVKDEQKALASQMPTIDAKINDVELNNAFTSLGLNTPLHQRFGKPQNSPNKRDSVSTFESKSILEPVKSTTNIKNEPAKDLSSSLLTFMSQTTSSTTQNNSSSSLSSHVLNPLSTTPSYNHPINFDYQNPQRSGINQTNPWGSNNSHMVTLNHGQDSSKNWSALDNLLPSGVGNLKVPMNMMITQNSPLLGNISTKDNTNQNCPNDLFDLLS